MYKDRIISLAERIQYDTGILTYIEERPKISDDYIVIEYYNNTELHADNKTYMWSSLFTVTFGTTDRYKILDLDAYMYDNFNATKEFEFDDDNERYNSIYQIELFL